MDFWKPNIISGIYRVWKSGVGNQLLAGYNPNWSDQFGFHPRVKEFGIKNGIYRYGLKMQNMGRVFYP